MRRTLLADLMVFPPACQPQAFPVKPVSLVVPFPAGAANEALARKGAGAMRDSHVVAMVETHFVFYFIDFISKVRLSCN